MLKAKGFYLSDGNEPSKVAAALNLLNFMNIVKDNDLSAHKSKMSLGMECRKRKKCLKNEFMHGTLHEVWLLV